MRESARLKPGIPRRPPSPKRAELLLRLEHAVALCVSEADSVSAGLKAAIRAVCEALDWDCGRFFRVDAESITVAVLWELARSGEVDAGFPAQAIAKYRLDLPVSEALS